MTKPDNRAGTEERGDAIRTQAPKGGDGNRAPREGSGVVVGPGRGAGGLVRIMTLIRLVAVVANLEAVRRTEFGKS